MNMNEIPTPETDAAIKTIGLYRGDEMEIVDPEFARDLERRLTVAREALRQILHPDLRSDKSKSFARIAEEALTQTEPKQ